MEENIYRIQTFTRKILANKLFKVCCLDLSNSFLNTFYQVKHKKEYARHKPEISNFVHKGNITEFF